MKKRKKMIECLVLVGIIGCIAGGCAGSNMRKKEEQARREEIMAGYPDEIKAYLEEKYGREFCVASGWESEGGSGSPVPFAQSSYVSYKYLAWENEEDGYAFWTRVYPVSLEDKEIREIKDNYYWKFISRKMNEDLKTRLEGILDDCKIISFHFGGSMLFGKETNQDSEIKDALLAMDAAVIDIWVFVSPEMQFDEGRGLSEIEKIVEEFYNDYFRADTQSMVFIVKETNTEKDYLKIEPEKMEQYFSRAINEDEDWEELTRKCINKVMINKYSHDR